VAAVWSPNRQQETNGVRLTRRRWTWTWCGECDWRGLTRSPRLQRDCDRDVTGHLAFVYDRRALNPSSGCCACYLAHLLQCTRHECDEAHVKMQVPTEGACLISPFFTIVKHSARSKHLLQPPRTREQTHRLLHTFHYKFQPQPACERDVYWTQAHEDRQATDCGCCCDISADS
jgi:hypothetical protein